MTTALATAIERHALMDEAERLGLDVDPDRCDWDAVADAVEGVLGLAPERRARVVEQLNDGWEIAAVLP